MKGFDRSMAKRLFGGLSDVGFLGWVHPYSMGNDPIINTQCFVATNDGFGKIPSFRKFYHL